MSKFISNNSKIAKLTAAKLSGQNETGSHWRGGSYRAHMLLVANSICICTCPLFVNPVILVGREGPG